MPNPVTWVDPLGLSCKEGDGEIPENYDPLTDTFTGSHGFRTPDGDQEELVTVYRGVHPSHPDYKNALKGESVPWGGHRDIALHNYGDNKSDFTSWTTNPDIARRFATDKPDAIILEQQVKRKDLIWSPDIFMEHEVLRLGPTNGATIK